jgi:hypothetical protein
MKAMRISQYGDTSVMQLQDIPQPKPAGRGGCPRARGGREQSESLRENALARLLAGCAAYR